MENFIVSARKYRPATFDTVVGQAHITNTLQNAIRTNQLAQAFLFCGPRGVGKTTCARILAKTINCQNLSPETEACDTCESCISFKQGGSMNIHELDAASNNSVDDIRSLVDQVRYAPQSGKKKIYIIDEVHMLSQSAFNAFLKTLEEPPPYAIFILATTEKHKIIPTILSRCQIFDFNRIQINDITQHLQRICEKEKIQAEAQALHIISQKADGALRDALSIFDQVVSFANGDLSYKAVIDNLNILDYDYYFKVTYALLKEDAPTALLLFDEILDKGFDGNNFIIGLAEHFRNLLVCKDPKTLSLLAVSEDVKEKYNYQAQQSSASFLLSALAIAAQCDVQYKMSKNQRLHVELALLKLSHINAAVNLMSTTSMDEVKKKLRSAENSPESRVLSPESGPGVAQPATDSSQPVTATHHATRTRPNEESATGNPQLATNNSQPTTDTQNASRTTHNETNNTEPATVQPKPLAKSSVQIPKFNDLENTYRTAKEQAEAASQTTLNLPKDAFTNEAFFAIWKAYAEQIKAASKTNFYILLTQRNPEIAGEKLTIKIENKVQRDLLNEEKTELMAFIREKLNNFSIELEMEEVEREDKGPLLYTASDKFKHLAAKNPNLLLLKNRLGLDLDY